MAATVQFAPEISSVNQRSERVIMEVAPLVNALKDLQERTDVLRGYL